MGQGHAVGRPGAGQADDVLRADVRGEDRGADDPPAEIAPGEEIIGGRVLVLADDPRRRRRGGGRSRARSRASRWAVSVEGGADGHGETGITDSWCGAGNLRHARKPSRARPRSVHFTVQSTQDRIRPPAAGNFRRTHPWPSSSASTSAPTRPARSSYAAATARSWAAASPPTAAAARASSLSPATRTWRASIRATTSPPCARASRDALAAAARTRGFSAAELIAGIGVDTTGSSPIPVDRRNRPLALDAQVAPQPRGPMLALEGPHQLARGGARSPRSRPGCARSTSRSAATVYSSEWFWSKIWHCLPVAPAVFHAAHSWVELADWIPSILAGVARSPSGWSAGICAAGHKALYSDEWGGLPDKKFLWPRSIPAWRACATAFTKRAFDATTPAGFLGARLGRPARACSPASRSRSANSTSTTAPSPAASARARSSRSSAPPPATARVVRPRAKVRDIPGICGIVPGADPARASTAIEAGQSAVGDIFNWWVETRSAASDKALHDRPDRRGRPPARPARAGSSPSTGTTATARSSSTRGSPGSWSAAPSTRRRPRSTARSSRRRRSARA